MLCRGEYSSSDSVTYGVLVKHTKYETEAVLVLSGTVVSAYKVTQDGSYCFQNTKAKNMVQLLQKGLRGCTAKNGTAMPFQLGAMTQHEFNRAHMHCIVQLHMGELVGAFIDTDKEKISIEYNDKSKIPENIPYIKLQDNQKTLVTEEDELNAVPVRSVQEIALEKDDLTWLKDKKYFIVNDDETAEKIFSFLDSYKGVIAYDTETTGLKINCFGKIGSHYKDELDKFNAEHPDEKIRADRLVGIIFCVEPNVSYYFPCFNRKFKNLYQDKNSKIRNRIIKNIKARYTVGDKVNSYGDMRRYIMNTPEDEWDLGVILMERVRDILEKGYIVTHGGTFEWKVGWQYEIDTNISDDTMIQHQLMFKFRSTTSNSGEPSNLKYLSKHELGIDQWELKDFFPNWKEDKKGLVRDKQGEKKNTRIDFSYMDYEGTRVYAPTDGDCTFLLNAKYKPIMMKEHKDLEYLYSIELIVSMAVAYMEFYGHRIDEDKIFGARLQTRANIVMLESEIRQMIDYANENEKEHYDELKQVREQYKSEKDQAKIDELENKIVELCEKIETDIKNNTDKSLNLAAPGQVADLFYNKLGYPMQGDKASVSKKVIKALTKETDENGKPKYPVAVLYSKYKAEDTLMTKFFDNLPYFMYPGGYIFSSYGQIAAATGRMSCKQPNAQQYPKVITKIVVPRDGFIMADADYSQIEYRVLTALAHNDGLAKLFSDPDSDYHTLMASMMYEVPYSSVTPSMRSAAKSFNFGIPYGMGNGSLAILLTGKNTPETREEAAEKYEMYFKNQPRTRKFFSDIKEMAQINKYTKTLFNRYRYYSFTDKDGKENNAKKAAALRQAGNAVIQGCLDGDTLIQTKEFGIVKIKNVVNKHLEVWDGDKWSHGDILYSGKKRKCIVTFNNGQKFICSPTHKFLVRSHKGNDRFVECQNLITKEKSKNPHRVVVNSVYTSSEHKYTSEWAYKYKKYANNANNVFIENMNNSFEAGMVLGRLASDGSIIDREVGGSCITQYVAEHEQDVADKLLEYMEPLGVSYSDKGVRENRNEKVVRLCSYSKSLVKEVSELDIKHKIHDNIFMDTELLRGFIKGMFDGDGGISGKTITLTFGNQYDFEPMCRDIQKALAFFGVRSRYYKYDTRSKIVIKTNDNSKFLSTIGFINECKQRTGEELECIRDEHIFGQTIIPETVEITDEYIDMYDVCNTDGGYYVADGIVTHNTAADIFKIGVARNFNYIRKNKLFGKLLIVNMIHDEQLLEIDAQSLNVQRVLTDVGKNMQFDIEGFPPLYIGAGVGPAWGYAKGKMAEIHPNLLAQLTKEAETMPIYKSEEEQKTGTDTKEVLQYFQDRVYEFRRKKVADYLVNPENWHKDMHPAIASLINLQFNFGRGDDAKAYVGPNGEKYTDTEFLQLNTNEFIEKNNLPVEASWFNSNDITLNDTSEEEDKEYSDDDETDIDDVESEDREFTQIDDSGKLFGSDIHDLIGIFKVCVLEKQRICGIDTRDMYFKKKDLLIDFLMSYICDEETPGAVQIVFLTDSNILKYTGIYVCGLTASALEQKYKEIMGGKAKNSDYSEGDIHNRSQAK